MPNKIMLKIKMFYYLKRQQAQQQQRQNERNFYMAFSSILTLLLSKPSNVTRLCFEVGKMSYVRFFKKISLFLFFWLAVYFCVWFCMTKLSPIGACIKIFILKALWGSLWFGSDVDKIQLQNLWKCFCWWRRTNYKWGLSCQPLQELIISVAATEKSTIFTKFTTFIVQKHWFSPNLKNLIGLIFCILFRISGLLRKGPNQ